MRSGKLLQLEGAYSRVSDLLYRVVVQEVSMLGSESWVTSDVMMKAAEGNHKRFLHHIMVNQVGRKVDRAWETPLVEKVIRAVWTQSAAKYIRFWKATVEQ